VNAAAQLPVKLRQRRAARYPRITAGEHIGQKIAATHKGIK